MSEAKERLMAALPQMSIAMSMARVDVPDGSVLLAVIGKRPDGSGMITATFEGEQFLEDVAKILRQLVAYEGA